MNKLTNSTLIWDVSTEGDVEGRSIQTLGRFQGSVKDLVRKLSGYAFYKLYFKEVTAQPLPELKLNKKHEVHFEIEGQSAHQTLQQGNEVNMNVAKSNYYEAVKYVWQAEDELEMKRQAALEKLSADEKKILGLEP